MTTPEFEPYKDDIEHLEAFAVWLHCKAVLRRHERAMTESGFPPKTFSRRGKYPNSGCAEWAKALEDEARIREEIEGRLDATKESGTVLGIEFLKAKHHLTEVERVALMLASLVALDGKYQDDVAAIGCDNSFSATVAPEVVWDFLGANLRDKVASRSSFARSCRLVDAGLATIDVGRDAAPVYLRTADINITESAFNIIIGITVGCDDEDE